MVILSSIILALAALVVVLALAAWRMRAERDEVLELVGADAGPLPVAVQRELRRRVPRDELSATLFSREAILEAAPIPTLVMDRAGTILRANRAAREAFPAAAPGRSVGAISEELALAVSEVLAGPPAAERELLIAEPAPRTYEAFLRSHPDGASRSAVAVLIDVTAQVDFREARRMFSAAVSHELRTPLARILGLAETLALPLDQDEREALVAQTEIEVDNMRRLIDEMLLLAALDRGDAGQGEEGTDAAETAAHVVEDRRARPAARGCTIAEDLAQGLLVPVPPRLLEVVVGNLVDNALRHGGEGITVGVAVRGLGGEVEIAVTDDGRGIAPEQLPHVFQRFYRGEASRSGPGFGLGLALVKHIAEAHGGRVTVTSTPGRGTTVRLMLPEVAAVPTSGY